MGEAKRRKARDPTYGRPKRGLVVSPPVEIQGDTLSFLSQLDPQELRFALLFWDKLVWPKSRSVYIASGPDESFLEQAGILGRPEYTFSGVAAQGFARTQIQAFLDLDQREPGVWSLAQGEDSFLLQDRILTEGNGAFVELHRAIPVPDKDVPLDDILRFRDKRSDELQLLRRRIDTLVASINDSRHPETELAKHIAYVDTACADALRVGKEWPFRVRLATVKVQTDLRPFASFRAALEGWGAGVPYGEPLALASAAVAGVAASIKIVGAPGIRIIRPRRGPFRYVSQFHQEVF